MVVLGIVIEQYKQKGITVPVKLRKAIGQSVIKFLELLKNNTFVDVAIADIEYSAIMHERFADVQRTNLFSP